MRLAISLLLSVLLLPACSKELSVEQKIIATLRTMEEAAEQGEHFDFMSYVADTFSAQHDSMDRRAFHRFMIFQINRKRRFQAQFFPIRVNKISTEQASARFNLLVTGGAGLLPESGQLFDVTTHWQLRDGDWKLSTAEWNAVQLRD